MPTWGQEWRTAADRELSTISLSVFIKTRTKTTLPPQTAPNSPQRGGGGRQVAGGLRSAPLLTVAAHHLRRPRIGDSCARRQASQGWEAARRLGTALGLPTCPGGGWAASGQARRARKGAVRAPSSERDAGLPWTSSS